MNRLTQQYVGGCCAGFGQGLIVGTWLSWGFHPGLVIPGSFLTTIGIYVASTALRAEQKPPASHTELE